jgi:hypothetical protein
LIIPDKLVARGSMAGAATGLCEAFELVKKWAFVVPIPRWCLQTAYPRHSTLRNFHSLHRRQKS